MIKGYEATSVAARQLHIRYLLVCSMPWLQWPVDWKPANMRWDDLEVKHLLALAAAGLSTIYVIHKVRQKKYHLPPGPYAFPIVGNLLCEWTSAVFGKITCFVAIAMFSRHWISSIENIILPITLSTFIQVENICIYMKTKGLVVFCYTLSARL